MLSGEKKMRVIANGAIDRLQEYTKSNKNTLTAEVTNHTDDEPSMWLYSLKEWMEYRNITIKTNREHTDEPAIMEICTRKTDREKIWQWARKEKIWKVTEIINDGGHINERKINRAPILSLIHISEPTRPY